MSTAHFFTPRHMELAAIRLDQRAQAQHARLNQIATRGLAQRVADLSGYYPSLGGGVLVGAAMAGLEPDDPQMAELAITDLQQSVAALEELNKKKQADGSPMLWSALKGATRTATLAFDFLWEEGLTRPIRTLVGVNQGMSWEDAYGAAGGSDALRALQALGRGERVNIGSGFLAQSDLAEETQFRLDAGAPFALAAQNPAQQALGTPLTQIGREQRETGIQLTSPGGVKVAVSPGRLLAINFAEPGTDMFNMVSGMADFSANIFLDPADKLLLGLGSMRDAAKMVQLNSARPRVLSRSWEQYVQSSDGRAAIDWLTSTNEIEPILGVLRRSQGYADPGLASALTKSTTADETAAILRGGYKGPLKYALAPVSLTGRVVRGGGTIGSRPIRTGLAAAGGAITGALPGGMGAARGAATAAKMAPISGLKRAVGNVSKDTYLGYLGTSIGAHGLSVRQLDQAVDDFGHNMILMGLDRKTRNDLLLRMANVSEIGAGPEMFGIVKEAVQAFARNLEDAGIAPELTKSVTKLYDDYNEMSAFWMNRANQPAFFPGARVKVQTGGQVVTLPTAHLFNELMEQYVPILDPKQVRLAMRKTSKMRRAAGRSVPDWGELQDATSARLVDFWMGKVWKPLVLFRVAWPVRVISEEQIRMAALGQSSAFRHPLQWLSMLWSAEKAEDVLGVRLEDTREYQAMLSRKIDLFGHKRQHTTGYKTVGYGDPEFWVGRGFEYDQLVRDPLAVSVAEALLEGLDQGRRIEGVQLDDVLQSVKDRFHDGDLRYIRERFIHEGGESESFALRAVADGYVDSVMGRIADILGARYVYNEAWGVQMARLYGDEAMPGLRYRDPDTRTEIAFGGSERWFDQNGEALAPEAAIDMGLFPRDGFDRYDVARYSTGPSMTQIQSASQRILQEGEEAWHHIALTNWMTRSDIDDMFNTWATDIVTEIERFYGPAIARRLEEGLPDRLDHLIDSIPPAGVVMNPNTMGYDFSDALDDFRRYFEDVLDSSGIQSRALTEAEIAQEFIPTAEAMRLADMTPQDFEALFSTIGPINHWIPTRLAQPMPDGVYRFDGIDTSGRIIDFGEQLPGRAQNFVVRVRDNHIVAQMSYVTDNGRLSNVNLFSRADKSHPLSARADAQEVMMAMSAGLANPIESALDLVLRTDSGRPATLRQYLQALDVDDPNLNTVEEVFAALKTARGRMAPDTFPGLAGAESMSTTGGARSAYRGLRHSVRSKAGDPLSIKHVPQGRPQFVILDAVDHELLEGIARGELRGVRLRDITDEAGTVHRSKKPGQRGFDDNQRHVVRTLEEVVGTRAKDSWTKRPVLEGRGPSDYDEIVGKIFDNLMGVPTDKLSRSPAFRQFYWKRISELFPNMDGAARAAALDQMRKQGVTARTLREQATDLLRGRTDDYAAVDRLAGYGTRVTDDMPLLDDALTLEEADELAKALAMHEVKDLLYDISRKHNVFEMTRNIFPFGEAWYEIVSRWAEIVVDNPHILRRMHQGLSGARESGWFYQDPQTGEEVFNYPGSGLVANWMMSDNPKVALGAGAIAGAAAGFMGAGVPGAVGGGVVGATAGIGASGLIEGGDRYDPAGFQLTGRVQGLNLMLGQYMPGFGPMVQIPASTLARGYLENPNQDFLRELLLPFGFTDVDSMGDIVDTVAPSWVRKGLSAIGRPTGDDMRLYNNTVMDVLRAGATNGEYNLNTREGYAIALADAQDKAKYIYAVRALSAFAGPTGAGVRWQAEDITGKLYAFTALAQEYRDILDENQGSQSMAVQEFTQMFGMDPTVYLTPKTVSVARRSTTEQGEDFQMENPQLFEEYPLSAYYLRPDSPDEEFDYAAYISQLRNGTRVPLTPEQWVFERNDLMGRIAYERARDHVKDNNSQEARTWLRVYRMQLMERYEGYNSPTLGFPQTATREAVIREMESWLDNPELADFEAGAGIVIYLQARGRAVEALGEMGYSPSALQNADAGRPYRDWLRRTAQVIIDRHPSFVPAWVEVFSREIEDDDPEFLPSVAGVSF